MGTHPSAISNPSTPILATPTASGYRIINLTSHILRQKLNIMTDYIVSGDPRKLIQQVNKKNRQINQRRLIQGQNSRDNQLQHYIKVQVFSILHYSIRNVTIQLPQNGICQSPLKSMNRQSQHIINQQSQQNKSLGISLKYCAVIPTCILRISKIFKQSPLLIHSINKEQYIVGMIEGEFNSMKQFVDRINQIANKKLVESVIIAVCNYQGQTRLVQIKVKQMRSWNQKFSVGYLGCQLAEGWCNKWDLRKRLKNKINQQIIKNVHNYQNSQNSIQSQTKTVMIREQSISKIQKPLQIGIIRQKQLSEKGQTIMQGQQSNQQLHTPQKQAVPQMVLQQQTKSLTNHSSSTSSLSLSEIQQKCLIPLNQSSSQLVTLTYKGILKHAPLQDASTICTCLEYSKHCQQCFKEKQQAFYFFNAKTNQIYSIEKNMLFPRI